LLGTLAGAFANATASSAFVRSTITYVGGAQVDLTVTRIHFDAVAGETPKRARRRGRARTRL
jgi:hypothetical protein